MKDYRIDLKSYDFYLDFQVYENVKKMINAASKYDKEMGGNGSIPDAVALFVSFPAQLQKRQLELTKNIYERQLGKIFLCKENLTYGTIAHECLHAAFAFMRDNVGYIGNYVNDNYSDTNEEFLVSIFTDIYEELIKTLIKNKFKIKQELI
jgi:hypothetical protein